MARNNETPAFAVGILLWSNVIMVCLSKYNVSIFYENKQIKGDKRCSVTEVSGYTPHLQITLEINCSGI
jgi:hypothetical protein